MLKMFQNIAMKNAEAAILKNSESREIKPGTIIFAKVIKAENGMYLLNLKGEKILAKSERTLKEGELVKLKIERVNSNNELIVKIYDEDSKKSEGINLATKENRDLIPLIKKEVLKYSIEEKIFLNNKELDEIVLGLEHYKEKGREIEESLIKTLLFVKKYNINDEETFNGLRKYYAEKIDRELNIKDLEQQIKDEVRSFKEETTSFAKGLNKINSVNIEQGYLNIVFGLVGFLKPIHVEFKAENLEKELNPDNLTIVIKLQLEKLGKLDIVINVWKRKIELYFMTYEDGIDKKTFTNLKELKKRIEDIGYAVESIHINRRAESKVGDIGNINYKI